MSQQPSAMVLSFWSFRFKQIQGATGKTKANVEAAKPVHIQKSLLRSSVSRCKDIFGNNKQGCKGRGERIRRWFYVHFFMHTHGIALMQVLTRQTDLRQKCMLSILLGFARLPAGQGTLQVYQSLRGTHLKWRAGRQLRRSSAPTLCSKKAGVGVKIPPEITTAARFSSSTKLVSLCPASIHTPWLGCSVPSSKMSFFLHRPLIFAVLWW